MSTEETWKSVGEALRWQGRRESFACCPEDLAEVNAVIAEEEYAIQTYAADCASEAILLEMERVAKLSYANPIVIPIDEYQELRVVMHSEQLEYQLLDCGIATFLTRDDFLSMINDNVKA
jgi:hypothetical protein